MKNLLFPIVLIALFLMSCEPSEIQQGEIKYEITYPYSNLSGIMGVVLPKKMTVKFKGDKMIASIENGKFFRTDILSENNKKNLKMRLDFGSEKIETDLTPKDLEKLANSQPNYTTKLTTSGDTVAGLTADYYLAKSDNEQIGEFKCAFSNNLSVKNTEWFSSYIGTKGIPLIYIIERYGVVMQLRAVRFRSREIADEEFDTKKSFKTVSYNAYEKSVSELFQLITEE